MNSRMRLPNIIYKTYRFIKGNKLTPRGYPAEIDVGLTNHCNLNCEMCLNDKIKKKKGFISDDLFYSLVDCIEVKFKNKTFLGLGLFGEATIHPKFNDFIKYASNKGVKMKIATNCVALREDIAYTISESSMDLFEASIYTLDRERYNKIVGAPHYDEVMKNIHRFLRIAQEKKFEGKIRLRPFEGNKDEIPKYKSEFYDKYPRLEFDLQEPKQLENWAGFLKLPGASNRMYVRKTCYFPFSRFVVDWDGEVRLCCKSMMADDLIVGYVGANFDLKDMWNSQEFKKIQENFLNLDYRAHPSCLECQDSKRYINIF